MSATRNAELCRVTVFGPSGRADLAVPVTTTVSALLPTLVQHVLREAERAPAGDEAGAWVLQRLGEAPFDADGTPATLDWLDGERLHLLRAEEALPELDFDDIADGMATAVSRQGNRWNEKVNRTLFLSLTGALLGVIGVSLFSNASGLLAAIVAGELALVLCVAATVVARMLADRALAGVVGTAGCLFAALCGALAAEGVAGTLALAPFGVLVGALTLTGVSAALLLTQRLLAPDLPIVPFGCAAVAGLGGILAMWLHLGVGLTPTQNAVVVATTFFLLTLAAPKLATRTARLRGPQLPRTAEELKIDVAPEPAAEVVAQTGHADRYLSVLAIGSATVIAVALWYLLAAPTWLDHTLAGLLAVLVLLRAREFLNIGQRTGLALAGSWGLALFALSLLAEWTDLWRVVGVAALLGGVLLLVLAALRPAHRRLLPIWPHTGDVAEKLLALALIPFLMHALGVFAWARGLAG
ncbi:type VII secretion integral membrane protein EccD [Crossiella cryophila]|uniref:Type VII secretion integral membrane protein EccD n=1 Tax=Crossiella cryophila TaxID=43355 RepID=A0A7W7CCH3_9PSEU|nr:type VII secretion integral membrane protein EccD [Crossiella cryophila]MBB4678583.1 type VII secretion integral membrane protein EccD [Crossiella cryophila]